MLADIICQSTRFAHDVGELQVRWRICMTKLRLLWVTGPGKIPAGGQVPSVRCALYGPRPFLSLMTWTVTRGTKLDFGPHQIGDVLATTGAGEVALVGCDGPLTAGWGVSAVLEA
jgi:hypothetical protein